MLARYGRYEALRKIASGGMATVYLGRVLGEGGFERLVALKVMHPHIAGDPEFVAMFFDEARLAARIRHPNVVGTIDIQKTAEAMFLVMEYVDGPSLHDVRKHLKSKGKRIPIEIALRIVVDALAGLHEAHELTDDQGRPLHLVHRDVSPHNILVGQDGVARLTDFGVVRAEERITSTRGGELKGKVAYMAPEQVMGESVTRQADIYSASVCLWEAIVGHRLFTAPSDGALVHRVLEGNPTPPSEVVDCPPALDRVILRGLSPRPEDRYTQALDMADDLEDAARAAGLRLARGRDVAPLVRRLVPELDVAPARQSGPEPSGQPEEEMSLPSLPQTGSGPSSPMVALDSAPEGPSPIPERPPGAASGAGAPEVIGPAGEGHPSSPGQVSSPTSTSAAYSLRPTSPRSGLIAVVVSSAVALMVVAVVAIFALGRGEDEAAPASASPVPASASAAPASASAAPPSAPEPAPSEVPEPAPAEEDAEAEASGGAGGEERSAPPPAPRPQLPAQPRPPPSPEPAPTQFRPTEL